MTTFLCACFALLECIFVLKHYSNNNKNNDHNKLNKQNNIMTPTHTADEINKNDSSAKATATQHQNSAESTKNSTCKG